MKKFLTILLWAGRTALEVAEVAVRVRRALDQALDNNPWKRPMPWGSGSYWLRKD